MATPADVTQGYRRQTIALRAATVRELLRLWPALDWQRLDATYPAWALSVARLVQANRATSAGLAAAYLAAFREASGVAGKAPIDLQSKLNPEQFATSLRVTSVVATRTALGNGIPLKQATESAFAQSSGAMSRLVLDAGRDTVRASLRRDDRARGWRRVTSGRACQFCSMLAGRGAVYSADTADFRSHDHCSCSAEPAYF